MWYDCKVRSQEELQAFVVIISQWTPNARADALYRRLLNINHLDLNIVLVELGDLDSQDTILKLSA